MSTAACWVVLLFIAHEVPLYTWYKVQPTRYLVGKQVRRQATYGWHSSGSKQTAIYTAVLRVHIYGTSTSRSGYTSTSDCVIPKSLGMRYM